VSKRVLVRRSVICTLFGLLALLCAAPWHTRSMLHAQSAWVPEVLDPGPASQPMLVVDSQNRLHALWVRLFTLDEGTSDAIIYARRDANGAWTEPVDVLVPPRGGSIQFPAAVMDSRDTLHLIVGLQDGLYYAHVSADEAGRATNWSELEMISQGHAGPSDIALGPDGTLHVVYPEIYSPPGVVFHISSADGGLTWSQPQAVSAPAHPEAEPINAQIAVADSGRLHTVWTETIELFPPSGVFYALSDDGGQSWSVPRMMAGRGHSWISVGLEADNSRLHLIWTGTGEVVGKYHAWSTDGGLSWIRE